MKIKLPANDHFTGSKPAFAYGCQRPTEDAQEARKRRPGVTG
jgi:hypothetical protein